MTKITFHSAKSRLDGFVVEGHSGYAEEGSDIVCAAISAAVGLTECTINEVMALGAQVKVKEKDARISLKLPAALNDPSDDLCQTVMTGLLVYLQAMAEDYPENLVVLLDDDDED
ncbi:MAG: ribosomal-processing cysteine protease Prp [Oscillospiraceae bacterium]|nr:ribosomal-processing cysteine protease Prp [Oscillospiraceae bacterium]